jgi:hypothetical protein
LTNDFHFQNLLITDCFDASAPICTKNRLFFCDVLDFGDIFPSKNVGGCCCPIGFGLLRALKKCRLRKKIGTN